MREESPRDEVGHPRSDALDSPNADGSDHPDAEVSGEPPEPAAVWRRSDGDTDPPLYRFCACDLSWRDDDADGPEPRDDDPPVRYCSGVVRWLLKRTPLMVALLLVVHLSFAQLLPDHTNPLDALALGVSGWVLLGGIAWAVILAGLLYAVGVGPSRESYDAYLTLSLLIVLGVGTATAVLLSAGAETAVFTDPPVEEWPPADTEHHYLEGFGFLLLLLLGGSLVYDGMLRTESMFTNLDRKRGVVVEETSGAYATFRSRLAEALAHDARKAVNDRFGIERRLGRDPDPTTDGYRPVYTSYLFAVVFLLPFFLSRLGVETTVEPEALVSLATTEPIILLNVVPTYVANFLIVVVFFQFLVLITFFNRLLTNHGPPAAVDDGNGGDATNRSNEANTADRAAEDADGEDDHPAFSLRYDPDHVDGYGGFKDIGRFATRVNMLLVLGGFYCAYRIYVWGLPTRPPVAETSSFLVWSVLFLGPLLVYAIAVLVWLYFSFWQIHRAMRRGKQRYFERHVDGESRLSEHREAPTWPVDGRLFVSLLSLDALPLLSLLPLI